MPKKEYIERVALIKFAMDCIPNIHGDTTMKSVKRALKAAPAADDVVDVVHGEWIYDFSLDGDDFYLCSVCGRQEVLNGLCAERSPAIHYPYCHCGAKMGGRRKDKP